MTAKKKSAPHSRAANAKETARRFGLRLQGSAREGVVILLLAACVFLLLALYSFRPEDPGWSRSGPETEVANWMGAFGAWLADVLYSLFGVSALWWPGMLGFAAWWLIRSRQVCLEWDATALAVRCGGLVLLLLGTTTLGALHFYHPESTLPYSAGGILGEGLVGALLPLVGSGGTSLLALAAILCGVPLFTGLSWLTVMDELGRLVLLAWRWVAERFAFRRETEADAEDEPSPSRQAAPQPDEASEQAPRPAWWRRLLPGHAESAMPALQGAGGRRDPGFGDDGKTEIPWDVPERTPSAKRPEAAYTAREPKVSLEPTVPPGAASGASPAREAPSAARRDEPEPEPLRATRDEPELAEGSSSRPATPPRASAFVTPQAPPSADPAPREPSLSARDERPSPAPSGP
ncbi:DNA translocase FtsK, partial [Halomonas maura]|uniref:DNA translocase FtsK n=1 Tax=Halomonas maura TaxID=117606 RepID=UPI0025B5664D